jgi:uncharacterized membrane protein
VILTVVWGGDDFDAVDLMTSQGVFTSQYFVSNVMAPMIAKMFLMGGFHILVDCTFTWTTARVHFSKGTKQFVTENHISHVPHRLDIPHLVQSGF